MLWATTSCSSRAMTSRSSAARRRIASAWERAASARRSRRARTTSAPATSAVSQAASASSPPSASSVLTTGDHPQPRERHVAGDRRRQREAAVAGQHGAHERDDERQEQSAPAAGRTSTPARWRRRSRRARRDGNHSRAGTPSAAMTSSVTIAALSCPSSGLCDTAIAVTPIWAPSTPTSSASSRSTSDLVSGRRRAGLGAGIASSVWIAPIGVVAPWCRPRAYSRRSTRTARRRWPRRRSAQVSPPAGRRGPACSSGSTS